MNGWDFVLTKAAVMLHVIISIIEDSHLNHYSTLQRY